MSINRSTQNIDGFLPLTYLSNLDLGNNENLSWDEIFLLLHGYSENGDKIYKRLGRRIQEKFLSQNKRPLILAPNALYPLPKAFPLDRKVASNDPNDLLSGYAWYFYHAPTDKFLIPYEVPATILSNWINKLNLHNKPVTIIGYSQGGYLAPWTANLTNSIKRVIGVNCSFRTDLIEGVPQYQMDQYQGRLDTIIDTQLAHDRFLKLKSRGTKGKWLWLEKSDHKLDPEMAELIVHNLLNYS